MIKEIFSVELPFNEEIKKQILVDGRRDQRVIIHKYFLDHVDKLIDFLEKMKSWHNLDEEELRIIQRSIENIESKKVNKDGKVKLKTASGLDAVSIILSTEIYGDSIGKHASEDIDILGEALQYEIETSRFSFVEYANVFLEEKMEKLEDTIENSVSPQVIGGWVAKVRSNGRLKKDDNSVHFRIINFVKSKVRYFEFYLVHDPIKVSLFYTKNRLVLELESEQDKKVYELMAVDRENYKPIKINL